ncbi:hypothetical protein O181_011955 [Austropuccinia psidii MF-1]|uniref:3-beta hydroxysteroid dehydrogenase/isomerase domain-containing protein n=1 Tax=Austropuccinia psidii MF-1 TaxID=1389203 RepID=A0A9Q3GMF4_9BASI|nr:hypothetical protein [Austropuccinia psidii MF-1]
MTHPFQPQNIVVIGGEGFLGHNLVVALIKSYPNATIHSLDLVQRHFDSNQLHRFIKADLTSLDSLVAAFELSRPELVFHTAASWTGSPLETCQSVNVQGTLNTIVACKKANTSRLIYTSSAGVLYNGRDLINVDERLPVPKIGCDHYNITKAQAEKIILEANGKDSLLTCAIRPAGIFGPGDRQTIPSMIQVLKDGKHSIQIGRNRNLFDFTYVDNVVHAHILAAQKLDQVVPISKFSTSISPISKTTCPRTLFTSTSKTDGEDISSTTDDGELVELSSSDKLSDSEKPHNFPISWIEGREDSIDQPTQAKRHRWDQWASTSTSINRPDGLVPIAGEAFLITNGEPIHFWDLARAIWHTYVRMSPSAQRLGLKAQPNVNIVIPAVLGMIIAYIVEFLAKLRGKPAIFRPSTVRYTCAVKYHNIEKARVVLGYEPLIGISEGIKRSVEWYISTE